MPAVHSGPFCAKAQTDVNSLADRARRSDHGCTYAVYWCAPLEATGHTPSHFYFCLLHNSHAFFNARNAREQPLPPVPLRRGQDLGIDSETKL
jgi:hypothetical protein